MLIAITGGTGFVGAALIDEFLQRSYSVRALVRDPVKLHRTDGVEVITGGLSDRAALHQLCAGAKWVIHCAGLTHARRNEDFITINVKGAQDIALNARQAGAKLIHISSLAARGPHISAYAHSKRESENVVFEAAPDAIVLRAPAMFGPRDTATLPIFKAVKRGIFMAPAAKPEPRASILYIDDFVGAVCAAFEQGEPGNLYEVGDDTPDGHSWAEIGEACAAAMNAKARLLALPKSVLAPYGAIAGGAARLMGRAPMVTSDKIREFFHPDWAARENLLANATGWSPQIPLKEGFEKTTLWYQEHGWL